MGLYLCVLDEAEEELDGIDVGAYADYGELVQAVTRELEDGKRGSKYPTLVLHSDCDGEWSPGECIRLESEIKEIIEGFRKMPPRTHAEGWQSEVARSRGLRPQSLIDAFIDVDGQPVLMRILDLCRLAQEQGLPILFQ